METFFYCFIVTHQQHIMGLGTKIVKVFVIKTIFLRS